MHIVYFITAHGYGHAVRSAAIANRISPEIKITFRTNIPSSFFHEELSRPFSCVPGEFDCGCIQSSSVTVDMEKTLSAYNAIAKKNSTLLQKELSWCRENRADCIVSDITPFAFEVARNLGIPSVAVSNFTWLDIYQEYAEYYPEYLPLLKQIRIQYSFADLLLALEPSLQMPYFRERKTVPVVGRRGSNVKEQVIKKYGISPRKKLGLIYIGDFGMNGADWERLSEFKDWEFIGLNPLSPGPSNYHIIDKKNFRYQDLTASSDLVISKLGYGVVSECFLNGVPLLYLPRKHFAEYPILEKAVSDWGGGICLTEEQFLSLSWKESLKCITTMDELPVLHSDGAEICASSIERMLKDSV